MNENQFKAFSIKYLVWLVFLFVMSLALTIIFFGVSEWAKMAAAWLG
jgi:choline-glycine betaine transporter